MDVQCGIAGPQTGFTSRSFGGISPEFSIADITRVREAVISLAS